ncbi:aldo/keto reductase [Desemzia sp. RIT804]|uniref:aldo/keto reductase n=1 Tax=Desemzia sp. RIT 804 TaxID=2810209 RepID=UPI0019514F8F|nr:aldo/keto reductase [Desemzia sp. RIT 804]MBM6614318.1 aldo/keto reductase [Desemzia sp. RIT 804]
MVVSLYDRIPLNNGYTIPRIGLGTAGLSGTEAEEAVFYALNQGYRLIDTAASYDNEEEVGRGINLAINSGISRDEIFVVTKIAPEDMGFEKTIDAFEASLERLNTQYIDLLLIHRPAKDDQVTLDTWRAMEEIYASGRVQSIGVSNFSRGHLAMLLEEAKVRPAVNQYQMYPGASDRSTNDYCDDENIVSMAYSPLKKGKVQKERRLMSISENYDKTPEQIALRWSIDRNVVPIPRSGNKDHIRDNIDIFDFNLSDNDMTTLNNLDVPRNERDNDDGGGNSDRTNRRKNIQKGRGSGIGRMRH